MPQSIDDIRRKARERAAAARSRDRDGVNAKKRAWAKTEKAKASKKRWNIEHPESVRATRRKLIRINRKSERDTPEKAARANERTREWYHRHIEKVREISRLRQKSRREANREEYNQRSREYASLKRAENPEKFRIWTRNRKARKRAAPGVHTIADAIRIRAAQSDKCAYCRVRLNGGGQLDHIVALSRGGSNWPKNLQWLCASCNMRKHTSDPIEFARAKGMLL